MTIAQFAEWANRYELTLARDFVEHLDELQEKEARRARSCSRSRGPTRPARRWRPS